MIAAIGVSARGEVVSYPVYASAPAVAEFVAAGNAHAESK
jgi:hypothetical protein